MIPIERDRKSSSAINSFKTITGQELVKYEFIELPMLVDGLLQKSGVSVMAGASDLGKSSILRQLAVEIVTGKERFCGFKLNPTHKQVLYISSEDDDLQTSAMLKKLYSYYPGEDLSGLRFVFEATDLVDCIERSIDQIPADLIIVDCFLDFFGTRNMNQSNEVRAFLNPLKILAAKHHLQIILLHHLTKRSDEREPNKASLLGSGAMEHVPRCVLELRGGYTPNQRYLCILKANFLPAEAKEEAHELRFENMRFVSTGQRKPLWELVKPVVTRDENKRERDIQILELAKQKVSQKQIARQLEISPSTVNAVIHGVRSDGTQGNRTNEPI